MQTQTYFQMRKDSGVRSKTDYEHGVWGRRTCTTLCSTRRYGKYAAQRFSLFSAGMQFSAELPHVSPFISLHECIYFHFPLDITGAFLAQEPGVCKALNLIWQFRDLG